MTRAEVETMADRAKAIKPERPAPVVVPYKPFPVDALPEPVRSFVIDTAKSIPCDPSFVALPLLAAFASAIGTTRRIKLKLRWREFPIIWAAVVAASGKVKSPPFDVALEPVYVLQSRAMKEYQEKMEDYRKERTRYESELTEWKRKGRKAGEPLPEPPNEPKLSQLFVDDATVESLAPRLLENPRGLLVASEEISGWFGSFNQYKKGKGSDESHWLKMHGGRALKVDRKTGDLTTIFVPRAAVCITGTIQPEVLKQSLGHGYVVNGIAARFLFAMPETPPKKWTNHDVNPQFARAVGGVFDRLYGLEHVLDENDDPQPIDLSLTPEALELAKAFVNKHGLEQVDMDEDLSAAWAKLEGYAFRLALVIHLVRCAANDQTLRNSDHIDADSLQAGIWLAEWFGNEARRIYAMLAESEEDGDRRMLATWIERKGGRITVRELAHGMRQYRGKTEEARAALDELAEAGYGNWVCPKPEVKGGRPSEYFQLATSVTVTETPTDDPATGGSGDGDGDESDDWGEL